MVDPVLGQGPHVDINMVDGSDFCVIVNCQREYGALLYIYLAEFLDFCLEQKEGAKERSSC